MMKSNLSHLKSYIGYSEKLRALSEKTNTNLQKMKNEKDKYEKEYHETVKNLKEKANNEKQSANQALRIHKQNNHVRMRALLNKNASMDEIKTLTNEMVEKNEKAKKSHAEKIRDISNRPNSKLNREKGIFKSKVHA